LIALTTTTSNNGQVLDLGTGRGNCLQYVPTNVTKIFALDKSSEMVALTSNKYKYVEISVGDVCHTPYASSSMDLIFCVGVSEYVEDADELLTEINRILREPGYAIFTSSPPNLFNWLRILFGHTLYLRTQESMIESIIHNGLKLLSTNRTVIQNQYLLVSKSLGSS
jgi:ubiquinone/menaquinone biosynthesis C-methylase UbiE